MTQVTFYMLEQDDSGHPAHWLLACDLAAQCYRNKQRCIILCDDQKQAESFDELLWQQPVEGFIPHNLNSEGPANGTPVQIVWQSMASAGKPVLINLAQGQMPDFAHTFKRIFDFVPAPEELKQNARNRYKQYRAAGFTLTTEAASSINENTNG